MSSAWWQALSLLNHLPGHYSAQLLLFRECLPCIRTPLSRHDIYFQISQKTVFASFMDSSSPQLLPSKSERNWVAEPA